MGEKKKQKKEFDVQVDIKRCKGCGICVALCPEQVLELKFPDAKCHVARIQDCIGCLMCEMHCPDFAIICSPKEKQGPSGEKDQGEGKSRSAKRKTAKVKP